jgi:2-C-methyl-D-erythritol 4-phosphate cytidylyltransferase
VPLAGRPRVEWSVAAFGAAPSVRSIVVACPPGHAHGLAGSERDDDLDGVALDVVEGGATRSESVSNALVAVSTDLVAIHDAARPLVTAELIEGVIATLLADPEAAGAIAAIPVTDTIKRVTSPASTVEEMVDAGQAIEATPDRERLWAAQTPQVFRVEALREALSAEPARLAAATDEAMLVEAAGGRVLIHPAASENLKVTTALDLRLAELLLAEQP